MYAKYARTARKTLQKMLTIKEITSIIMHHLPSIQIEDCGSVDLTAYRYWYALGFLLYHTTQKMSNDSLYRCRHPQNTSINRNVFPLMLVFCYGNTAHSLCGIALYGFRQNVKLMRYCLRDSSRPVLIPLFQSYSSPTVFLRSCLSFSGRRTSAGSG